MKCNKNDFNDAQAIAEAASRPTMRCVPLKTQEQIELQVRHRVRQRFITERAAVVNQMRSAGQGVRCVRPQRKHPGHRCPSFPATIAAVGDGKMFGKGRDMAARLELVPRQYSTGGKPHLGPISKRGNSYLRQLFPQVLYILYSIKARISRHLLGDA